MTDNKAEFDWDRSVEDLLTETRRQLLPVFAGTGYRLVRDGKDGEKMNNILPSFSERRVGYIVPKRRNRCFTIAFQKEYLYSIRASGAKHTDILKEIKPGRYPNWGQFDGLSFEDLQLAVKAILAATC